MLTNLERMQSQELGEMLPTDAVNKGYRLTWFNPRYLNRDPTILFLKGREVYEWNYDPTMGEVWDKIRELEEVNKNGG